MDKTDVESLSTRIQKPSQEKCGSNLCCYSVIAVLCLIFSTAALALSVITLCEIKYSHTRSDEGVVISESHGQEDIALDWPQEDEILSQLEMQFETEGTMRFSSGHKTNKQQSKANNIGTHSERVQRDTDHYASVDDLCNSTSTSGNHSELKPLAHIVPIQSSKPINTDDASRADLYIQITKQWTCSRPLDVTKSARYGIISGGMVFNRTSGFLRLPKDGVYYVYSHVLFQLFNSHEAHRTSVKMVACIPEIECELTGPEKFSVSNGVAIQYKNKLIGDDGIYQGGLYHFSAGTEISILAINPKGRVTREERGQPDKLFISRAKESSYFGAFLVQELEFNAIN